MNSNTSIPLCVDLDGTLVKLDTLHQALFLLLRRDTASILRVPGWLMKGKAYLKDQIMQRVTLDAPVLPYNQPFLEWLNVQHAEGRKLVLTTASNYRTAQTIAEHLGIFDEILASSEATNLRDNRKLTAIREHFEHFGYAGNDKADFPVWDAAKEIILVNPTRSARTRYGARAHHLFIDRKPLVRMSLKAMRCQQWIKNLLIFSPMFLAHRFTEAGVLIKSVTAFFSFSFAASAIYVLNDLFDLSADQHHPRKRRRPFASGDLPVVAGLLLTPLLVIASLVLSLFLPFPFLQVLLVYYLLTTLYSWRIKQIPVADVLMLAGLYAMRILAGAAATDTSTSIWFIEFSIFLFLSLALLKRMVELREMKDQPVVENARRERGYKAGDLPLLLAFGIASGYIATFVFTMYLGSEKVTRLYSRPHLLWIFCPLLLYWITRMWHLAWRGRMQDDPLAFATKDPQTCLISVLGFTVILFAI